MGYQKIPNLYKDQRLLEFKRVYVLEKVHGTSAHVRWNQENENPLSFFSGGGKHNSFLELFDADKITQEFQRLVKEFSNVKMVIYGEYYGGSMQAMSHTYGSKGAFIAFDVWIDNKWLAVEEADKFCQGFGIEFVPYWMIDATKEALDTAKMTCSAVAGRRGMGRDKMQEGVVIRPPFEVTLNNGERLIAKHKRDEFMETATPRSLEVNSEQLKQLADAQSIADEWVTTMRLNHILDKIENKSMENMRDVIREMQNDIAIEAGQEVILGEASHKAIGKRTVELFKKYLQESIQTVV